MDYGVAMCLLPSKCLWDAAFGQRSWVDSDAVIGSVGYEEQISGKRLIG